MTTNRRFPAIAAAVLTLASCDSPTMTAFDPAYDPTTLTSGLFYHWPPGHDVTIYVDLSQAVAGTDLDAAVREGIAAWTSAGLLGEIRMRVVTDLRAANVIVHHSAATRLWQTEGCEPIPTSAGGATYFCVEETLDAVTFDLNDGSDGRAKMDVSVNRGAVDTDAEFRAVVIHELGHVLGIGGHSPNATDLMFGSPQQGTPTLDDIRTLRYVLAHKADVRF